MTAGALLLALAALAAALPGPLHAQTAPMAPPSLPAAGQPPEQAVAPIAAMPLPATPSQILEEDDLRERARLLEARKRLQDACNELRAAEAKGGAVSSPCAGLPAGRASGSQSQQSGPAPLQLTSPEVKRGAESAPADGASTGSQSAGQLPQLRAIKGPLDSMVATFNLAQGELVTARVGDQLPGGYSVRSITTNDATLTRPGSQPLTLRLTGAPPATGPLAGR